MTDPTRIYDDQHNNAPAVPQGWKLVPVEPTRAMWAAVNKLDDEMAAGSYDGKGCSIEQAWNCMLDFAPDAPALAATPAPAPAQEPAPTWSLREALQKAKDALSLALSDVDWRKDSPTQPVIHKAYNCAHQALALPTAEQVDDINVAESFTSVTKTAAPAQGEPFGYFRAEPFGWTDCPEDAEGAIALYEHPAHEKHWTENEPVRLPSARTDRVYLAGPMTGIAELNFPAFNQEAERLRAEGLQVLNPADHGIVDGADWADYLRHDIAGLSSCERIHLLRGWTKSKGACLEMTIAKALGMTVTYQVDAEIEHNNAPAVPQGEPVYQLARATGPVADAWIDVAKDVYDDAGFHPSDFKRRILYAAPSQPAVPQGWTKAADQVPIEADGEVFIRFTDGSIGTGWATYWHGASNEFAQWTFPDPDEDRTVLEWTKNPATPAPAPAPSKGAVGFGARALAAELAEAVLKDDNDPEGHDISAGLFGPNVSAWLRKVASEYLAAPAPAQEAMQSFTVPDDLPGMWEHSDLTGGKTDCAKPAQDVMLTDDGIATLWRYFADSNQVIRIEQDRFANLVRTIEKLIPATRISDRQFDMICQAIDKADTITLEGDYMLDSDDCIGVVRVMQVLFDIAALRAKGGK